MITGLYSSASAMRLAELHQDLIATNLAHMNVPGFRRSSMTTSHFRGPALQSPNQPGFGAAQDSLIVDFTSGPLVATGRQLDVAINGDGFFAVQGPEGTLYTRSGSFHVAEDGQLVGTNGMAVLGTAGPISIPKDIAPDQVQIADDGTITAGENSIGQLRLVAFRDNSQLDPVGTTLFASRPSAQISNEAVSIAQGMREQSNVAAVDELIAMIAAMRYHESAQRAMRSIDETVQKNTDPRG